MPTKISVLIVNSTLHIGGAEKIAACLAHDIDRGRFDVAACYLKEPGAVADQMVQHGVELLQLPEFHPGRRDYLSSLKLRRLIRSRGVNVIHTHDIHGMVDGAVCRMLMPGLRFVHTFHFGNYPHRKRRDYLIERALWRIPDAIVAVGLAQAKALRDCYSIPSDRLKVIWNGANDPKDRTGQERIAVRENGDIPVIASVSTLISQKGIEHLLQAAAFLRDSGDRFVLLIAGDGHLRNALHTLAQNLGLSNHVRFLGWVSDASDRVLPACDIFVQSSLWEAMSVVVLEAMASGKPMVVTRVGENSHVVVDGETGVLVPPGDPRALASGLRTLLNDAGLRQKMGHAARLRYEANFTTQHMISAYESLYRELAGDMAVTPPAGRVETA